jgi:hypothetical protein
MSEEIFVYDKYGNTSENSIAIVWHISDVKQAARDIGLPVPDDETCMGILTHLLDNHDANYGISWDNIYDELRNELELQINYEENDDGEV